MGSQWHYRSEGEVKGPVSFQDLAQLVRCGKLSEGGLVRREHTAEWVRVRDVIGLLRAAGKQSSAADAGTTSPAQPSVSPPAADSAPPPSDPASSAADSALAPADLALPPIETKPKGLFGRIGSRGILVGIALAVAALVVGYLSWQRHTHPLFPERARVASANTEDLSQKVLAAAAAARSKSPSVPGLASGVPQRAPGLDGFDAAGSFSLTDDLCTIVFGAAADSTRKLNLWISSRASVSEPFQPPQPIASCNSNSFESRPTLSPGGLKMIFMRAENGLKCFQAQRSSRSQEFGEPKPWVLPGLPGVGQEITFVRFLDLQHVLVSLRNRNSQPPFSFYVVEWPDAKGGVGPPKEIRLDGCGARVCLRPGRLLAYFGNTQGLFVQGRDSPDARFSPGYCAFDAEVCGPLYGPVWLAPGDDVVFYRSPGPGQQSSKRSIWMIRF